MHNNPKILHGDASKAEQMTILLRCDQVYCCCRFLLSNALSLTHTVALPSQQTLRHRTNVYRTGRQASGSLYLEVSAVTLAVGILFFHCFQLQETEHLTTFFFTFSASDSHFRVDFLSHGTYHSRRNGLGIATRLKTLSKKLDLITTLSRPNLLLLHTRT